MVGFSLSEIMGNVIDTAEERIERMKQAYDAAVDAFFNLRFDEARDHIETIKGEVDSTELFLRLHGVHPDQDKAKDAPPGPR